MASDTVQYITLTLGADMILKNPTDIITEMLRYYVLAPENFNDELLSQSNGSISLTSTISKYETEKNTLVEVITKELTEAFKNCFSQAQYIDVGVSTDSLKPGVYSLTISPVVGINGQLYTVSKTLVNYKGNLSFVNDNVTPMDWLELIEEGEIFT